MDANERLLGIEDPFKTALAVKLMSKGDYLVF
jgi:hypothetical protein